MYNPFILQYLTGYQPTKKELQDVKQTAKGWLETMEKIHGIKFTKKQKRNLLMDKGLKDNE